MIYRKEIELRYSDTDQMGVIYHANYFSFFEQGRTEMLKELGINYYDIEKRGYIFPVRDVGCTYLQSIRLGEKVFCETEIIELTKVRMDFSHRIFNENGVLKAKGYSSIISVNKADFSIVKMDKHLPDVYKIKEKI